ncbi:MAG: choloylglycine hydrolase family protein [Pseudomonadota bacterium]
MRNRFATYFLAAIFAVTTSPALACTGISLDAEDGAIVRGRTLEFGFLLKSNVIAIPKGQSFTAKMPDGSDGMSYKTRYGIVGANAVNSPMIVDGLNDQGLSIGLFYFPGYAKYAEAAAENASRALAPQDFGSWVLGNYATVDEVREAIKDIVIVPTPLKGFGSAEGQVTPVHFFFRDKSGKSIVIEPIDGKLKVSDAPLGVITNSPPYDWHMANLNNYINLSVKDVKPKQLGPVKLELPGTGAGLVGMPGDFTAPSRFIRAAIFSQAATPNNTADEAAYAGFHILNQFDIPKGSVVSDGVGGMSYEITEWTSMNDLTNLRFYMRTFQDQAIRVIDVKKALKSAGDKMMVIDVQSATQTTQDVTGDAKPADF